MWVAEYVSVELAKFLTNLPATTLGDPPPATHKQS